MSFAIILTMLAEAAATSCAPRNDLRLGGGAKLIRPVGEFGAAPLILLGPTTDIRTRPTAIQQTAAQEPARPRESGEPTTPCGPTSFPIA